MAQKNKKHRSNTSMISITSCISTTLVLVLLGTVVFFVTIGRNISNTLRENFTITLLLSDDMPNKSAYNLQTSLRKEKCVRYVTYISKERALKEQSEAMGSDPTEFLGSNPIPASFELHLNSDYANADSLKTIIPRLKQEQYVLEVTYPQELMDTVNENVKKISIILLIIAGLLAFVSFELINNTIRLSVYSHRFIINTMKLVGASWSFIRRPFLISALKIGLVSVIIATSIIGGGVYAILQYEQGFEELLTWDVIAFTTTSILICGILLTLVCAIFSVNKFLKMKTNKIFKI